MSQVIRAVYEEGMLRPLAPLHLQEHQQVRVTVESLPSEPANPAAVTPVDPLAGIRVSTGIADLAERFDDYRFGRRP
ncbi:MAG: antitoxin family protein [Thermoguttaceae bacterium]|jgi:predicted DNA-binding antitoxin AbrB/MazE fold protein